MALRSGHGNGAGVPRIETLPADELPRGVPAPAEHADVHAGARPERTPNGRWLPGASRAQAKGGRALKNRARLAAETGLGEAYDAPEFQPYRKQAKEFAKAEAGRLAREVGGGEVGPGVWSVVSSASLALAASRYLYDLAGRSCDPALLAQASRLADASRQHLLAAHELAAKSAQARRDRAAALPLDALTIEAASKPRESA